ncbi:MAG: FAD-dependent thymidylate synthase [Streptomyces sp.]|nr:FAD-dependent thymidylate synthase [Streptomyces sp.]NUS11345.1 FAD-dependent thymidylate synthase [Streptomyces sp.]NUS23379.1 FAD-dependent thymidylate synthase [Streptomyces sp.]
MDRPHRPEGTRTPCSPGYSAATAYTTDPNGQHADAPTADAAAHTPARDADHPRTEQRDPVTDIRTDTCSTIQLVKHNAHDADVIWAARVSTIGNRSLDDVDADPQASAGLINYLMRDRHGSPFEHTSLTFFIETPILVVREFVRHRVGWSYNETSGRYRNLDPVFYTPPPERPLVQVGRPGRYQFEEGTPEQHDLVTRTLTDTYTHAYNAYRTLLDAGVAREVARAALPVGLYTSMYATCNARSLMHYLSLRTHDDRAAVPSSPQWEIARVADQMEAAWAELMPLTHDAFNRHGRIAP